MRIDGQSIARALLVACACWACSPGPAIGQVPAAIVRDPPIDVRHPASGAGVQFVSHGSRLNAQLYRPAGAGAHPTVILLHGLPGNEQNLDLARAMQRAGWTVITFHYRGSWGSGGAFTLRGGVDDLDALLARLHHADAARAWGVDPARLVLVGHSYGGYIAARRATRPGVLGAVLIAPWDISYDARAWSRYSERARAAMAEDAFNDVDGRLAGATAASLMRETMRDGRSLDLTALAGVLVAARLLIVTAVHDDPDDQAAGLRAALTRRGATAFAVTSMPTDHGFNDHRIALETAVLDWLAQLPGAPPLTAAAVPAPETVR